MTSRRQFIACSLALGASGITPLARAQSTAKPARLLVGYPPGGSIDAIGRALVEKMRAAYPQGLIVENRPGNRIAPAVAGLSSAPADGNTFMLAPYSVSVLWPNVYTKLPFDPLRDLAPVSTVSYFDFVLAVGASVPVNTVAEYVEWVRANPKQNGLFGITGAAGGTPHFLGMLLAQSAGIQLTPVPYKGTVQGLQDLLGGATSAWIGPLGDVERFHRAGKARVIATTGPRRSRFLPQVPSFAESGHPTVQTQERFGVYARADTPAATVLALNRLVREAIDTADFRAMCEKFTSEASGSSPAEFDALIRQDNERWRGIVKTTGYTPEQ